MVRLEKTKSLEAPPPKRLRSDPCNRKPEALDPHEKANLGCRGLVFSDSGVGFRAFWGLSFGLRVP